MKCKHCGFEPANEDAIFNIIISYAKPETVNPESEPIIWGMGEMREIAKALVGKVGELVGKDNVDKKMDRLMEAHKKFCERMDKQKYMSVEEVEQAIASNVPIEFIQVIEPFKRAEVYKKLAQALTRLPKGVSKEEAIKILRQFRLCRFDYIKDIRSIKPHNLTDEELLEIYTALEGGE